MKLLIISDTHGFEQELLQVKEKYDKEVDMMIHCGDSELPSNHVALVGFQAVKGNCDIGNFPNDTIRQVRDVNLFATHGHLYNVKMTLMNLQYRAEEVGAKIICFGHSHLAGCEFVDGRLYINPGSFHLPRRILERTYCILEVKETEFNVQFFDHMHHRVESLCKTFSRKEE
ncbi:metallophosphoesterase family protein [Bacillus suaedaesalsae]|uniref:Phosphoesterase n=1 Tax=Bacillus suaedaesalsae TaxID=2810349 RepID=A0ABS2DMU6_9BACI|nr:metallophosphoesterase [Bacillus suaedaesalsae]MBM6619784.1 metallophosphoesterase [Bacillus suaedaesalsae]